MEQSVLTVSVPRELLTDSGFSEETAAMEMLKLFVINLYRHQQISGGKAAEILGIRKYDFIRILSEAGIAYFDYSMFELEEEFKSVEQWSRNNV